MKMSAGDDSSDRMRCEPCRTINLAKQTIPPKPNMQMYDKGCTPPKKVECPRVSNELPLHPTCIKVCTKEEFAMKDKKKVIPKVPYYSHGKLMYLVKAGILVGTAYFTYSQGVWGSQREAVECLRRWQEYIRSMNTRHPPTFDECGNVKYKPSTENFFQPIYDAYKTVITSCFAGVVKVPLILKCSYIDYINALERKRLDEAADKKLKSR